VKFGVKKKVEINMTLPLCTFLCSVWDQVGDCGSDGCRCGMETEIIHEHSQKTFSS